MSKNCTFNTILFCFYILKNNTLQALYKRYVTSISVEMEQWEIDLFIYFVNKKLRLTKYISYVPTKVYCFSFKYLKYPLKKSRPTVFQFTNSRGRVNIHGTPVFSSTTPKNYIGFLPTVYKNHDNIGSFDKAFDLYKIRLFFFAKN